MKKPQNVIKPIFTGLIHEHYRDLPSHLIRQEDLTVRISKGLLEEAVDRGANTSLLQEQHLKWK